MNDQHPPPHHKRTAKRLAGTIGQVFYEHMHGVISLDGCGDAFFYFQWLADARELPKSGTRVSCVVTADPRGLLLAKDIRLIPPGNATNTPARGHLPRAEIPPQERPLELGDPTPAKNLSIDPLPQAILARDNRDYDRAVSLYEKGLREHPTIQLILSYAAMERSRNRKNDAMRVYRKGLEHFPNNAKLHEDAGQLARSLGLYDDSIDLLRKALTLCRSTHQGGEKGVLQALARTYYSRGDIKSLAMAADHYEQAQRLAIRDRKTLPESDQHDMRIARIRIAHNRGNLTFVFLEHAGIKIINASLDKDTTYCADFIVDTNDVELAESFGLSGRFAIRCMFLKEIDVEDVDLFAAATERRLAANTIADGGVALIIVSRLSMAVQTALHSRIEQRRDRLVIVPITQSEIERQPGEAKALLREVLARWLYRRDLFDVNTPVVGRRFFGRGKALAQVHDNIGHGVPMAIFGLRKVGKTSLLQELERRTRDAGNVALYVDLLHVPAGTDCRWLYWHVANGLVESSRHLPRQVRELLRWRLGEQFSVYLDVPSNYPVPAAFDADLTQLLRAVQNVIGGSKPRVVLLLDEIEEMLPNHRGQTGFDGFFAFLSYLRGVTQKQRGFVLIVTGANAAVSETSQFDGRDNPVFNFFTEIYLKLLEPDECQTMLRELGQGMGIRFTNEAHAQIYRLTGGHPHFARSLCSTLAGIHTNRPLNIDRCEVEDALPLYLEQKGARDFGEIMDRLRRDFREEAEVCIELARRGGRMERKELRATSPDRPIIPHLVGYQLVRIEGEMIVLTMELMRMWLQRYIQ